MIGRGRVGAGQQHARRRRERQCAVVAQEHGRSGGGEPGLRTGLRGRLDDLLRLVDVRPVEQAERLFHPEHACHGIIESHRIEGCGIQADRGGRAPHLDVQPRVVGREHGVLEGLGDAVLQEVHHALGIADHGTAEAPLGLEHVGEQGAVHVHRHAGHRVERGHDRCDPCLHCRAEGLEVDVAKSVRRDVDGVVVAAALGLPVADVVLRGRRDRAVAGQIGPLIAAHHRRAHDRVQMHVLAEPLDDASPAGVA